VACGSPLPFKIILISLSVLRSWKVFVFRVMVFPFFVVFVVALTGKLRSKYGPVKFQKELIITIVVIVLVIKSLSNDNY